MQRTLISALLLLMASFVLGATVFREQVAHAAQAVLPVLVTNDASDPVPVRAEAAPVTVVAGAYSRQRNGPIELSDPAVATAVSIHMFDGVRVLELRYQEAVVADFDGPVFNQGNSSIVLAVARPIKFDTVDCVPGVGDTYCDISWIGALP
jgi:hypothetical protein